MYATSADWKVNDGTWSTEQEKNDGKDETIYIGRPNNMIETFEKCEKI